jgi:hypothetical protein
VPARIVYRSGIVECSNKLRFSLLYADEERKQASRVEGAVVVPYRAS